MGKHPFTAQNEGALIRKILRGVYTPPAGYSRPLLALVQQCLTFDARKRPSAQSLLGRPDVVAKAQELGIGLDQQSLVEQHKEFQQTVAAARGSKDDAGLTTPAEPMMRAHQIVPPVLPQRNALHGSAPEDHPFKAPVAANCAPAGSAAVQGSHHPRSHPDGLALRKQTAGVAHDNNWSHPSAREASGAAVVRA